MDPALFSMNRRGHRDGAHRRKTARNTMLGNWWATDSAPAASSCTLGPCRSRRRLGTEPAPSSIRRNAPSLPTWRASRSGRRRTLSRSCERAPALSLAECALRTRPGGAHAKSRFAWDSFQRPSELAFSGPRVDVGPGWVEGRGGYTLRSNGGGTLVRAWLEPTLGGLPAIMSPFAWMRNVRILPRQFERAKQVIEATVGSGERVP
jgi:hypothetical protein